MTSALRRPLIAGNWKMNLTLAQSVELAKLVAGGAAAASGEVAATSGSLPICGTH